MCFCVNRGVNTMVDILALIYKVRRGHFLILHPTQKHIRVRSFKFKMSKDLTALSWYNILQHSHFHCSHTAPCLYGTFRVDKKRKKTLHGSRCYLWNELAYLPDASLLTECLCLLRLSGAESQHTNVYLQSGCDHLPSFLSEDRCFMFVWRYRGFHGYHTHWRSERWGHRVSVEQDEWDSHTSEKAEKTCKVCCSASSLRGICWIFTTDSTEFNSVL